MSISFFVLISGLLVYLSAFARITDNQITFKVDAGVLKVEPKKGFHLNAEAPVNATFDAIEALYKPVQKTEKVFAFKIVDHAKKVKLSYYVCDDKKTVCEQHHKEITLATLKTEAVVAPAKTGFIVTDTTLSPSEVAKQELLVSKNGKPTLLVFSAPWCPACIRMQTETYPKPQVSEQLKKVNFVKLNSDLPENYDISEKFHVKAIPTLILLNTEGEEVYRWLDYQQASAFAKSLVAEIKKVASTKDSIEKRAAMGDAAAISELGVLYYNATDCAQAVKWLSLSKKAQDQKLKLAAEVACAQDVSEKDDKAMIEYLQTLEKAITLSPSKFDQVRWSVDWVEKKSELKQMSAETTKKAKDLLGQIEKQLKDPKQLAADFKQSTFGESAGFEAPEMNLMRSRLFASLNDQTERQKSDQKIIDSLKNKNFSVQKPGEMLIGIAYLREAQEKTRVEKLYKELIQKFSQSYVYYEKYSRYLLKEKSYELSLANVDKALIYSEGNQPQLYLLKARILKEMNQIDKMIETIATATQLKEIQHVRFKKTLVQLNKLKGEAATKQ